MATPVGKCDVYRRMLLRWRAARNHGEVDGGRVQDGRRIPGQVAALADEFEREARA